MRKSNLKLFSSKFNNFNLIFSVLQECTTDSEELLYKNQSSVNSNSPPDLLLTSNNQKHQSFNAHNDDGNFNATIVKKKTPDLKKNINKRHSIATTRHLETSEDPLNIKNEPVQFSFTLYDFDGHGKITKDDIAGIVSTIYDSIGTRVAVPHYGKKTINVKLTVSPENAKLHEDSKPSSADYKDKFKQQYRVHALLSDEENDSERNSENFEDLHIPSCRKLRAHKSSAFESISTAKHPVDTLDLKKSEQCCENDFESFTLKSSRKFNDSLPKKKPYVKKERRKQKVQKFKIIFYTLLIYFYRTQIDLGLIPLVMELNLN